MASDREDYGVKAPSLEIQFDGTDLYVVFNGVRIAKRGAKGTPQASAPAASAGNGAPARAASSAAIDGTRSPSTVKASGTRRITPSGSL